ncbi:MAG: two-component regulator propeller domain-containing protein, partial [Saprospiraceae bacterium]|nr:two-component regulator propeller domain-containing protein [Saprospiraceae bacterium]
MQTTSVPGGSIQRGFDSLFFLEGQLCAWVRNMFQDARGHLWFGTNHDGVMWYDADTLRYIDEDDGLGGGRLNGMVEDATGNVWFAT